MSLRAASNRPRVDADRIMSRIDALAAITEPSQPWSRTAFSDRHREGRAWLGDQFRKLGLRVSTDAGGNLFGRLEGSVPGLPALASGSHSDTVPAGGRFDGAAGIVVALEALECLRETGIALRHPFEVIDFLAEEPNRYGLSCIGSRALSGALTTSDLDRRGGDATTLAQGIDAMGGDAARLGAPLRPNGTFAAFVELHIEQGRVLEERELAIGVVTGIFGIRRVEIVLDGQADHSGATPMELRRDALAGAAEVVTTAERRARTLAETPFVATIGKFEISPNAANVVPGSVALTLEVRSVDDDAIGGYIAEMRSLAEEVASRRRLALSWSQAGANAPVAMNEAVRRAIATAAAANDLTFTDMPSGAGHDAAFMARLCPTGMIFVPSRHGRSHCPEEWTDPRQIAAGAQVLLDTLLSLDDTF